MMKWLGKNF